MRERLSAMNPDAAIEMWVGTFHSFGLELVTKWPSRVGRTAKVRILDQTGSLGILEDNLAKLPLRYFQNLYEPAYELVHVLRAISRCKDELISPGGLSRRGRSRVGRGHGPQTNASTPRRRLRWRRSTTSTNSNCRRPTPSISATSSCSRLACSKSMPTCALTSATASNTSWSMNTRT